jgi:DNA-binding transcriptional MerR regulator
MGTTTKVPPEVMRAGDAAKALGVGVQTLHYYEREGLIPPPSRSPSGYRLYTTDDLQRVRFIRKAQALGLPLQEVKDVLRLARQGSSPCGRVQAALTEKLREVNERLRELESFRDDLATLIEDAPALHNNGAATQVCAIVEEAAPLRKARPFSSLSKRRRRAR